MAVIIPHVEHHPLRRAHCQNPKSCFFLFQSLVFFLLPKSCPPLSPSSTLPLIQKSDVVPSFTFIAPSSANGQYFFYWQGIETKINLVAPRRQNPQKLANQTSNPLCTPRRPAVSQ
ncbi:hypothetical protein AVEN_110247-1 [Araneus ventricosus]|uniref:Uncharacterized protein n=1 Tax=Araneus ventricosus TaxID=182803 RepID=A0A4Y2VK54_ARAVE|nr:hypothetical protein AVEN_110247-1 [Araneus ventricosus]